MQGLQVLSFTPIEPHCLSICIGTKPVQTLPLTTALAAEGGSESFHISSPAQPSKQSPTLQTSASHSLSNPTSKILYQYIPAAVSHIFKRNHQACVVRFASFPASNSTPRSHIQGSIRFGWQRLGLQRRPTLRVFAGLQKIERLGISHSPSLK